MKIKSIKLENFAKYDEVNVSFDDKLTYLIGKNGSGKSTIGINAIWFMFQSIAEKSSGGNTPLVGERFRFIGPKSASAKGEMILADEKTNTEIKVIRKLTKTGTQVSFEAPEGKKLDQAWLTDLFNIFLIAPKKFIELDPKAQAEALGIDTQKFDDDIKALKQDYTLINREIKALGNLEEVEKVDPVDFIALSKRKDEIIDFNNSIEEKERNIEKGKAKLKDLEVQVSDMDRQIEDLERKISEIKEAKKPLQEKIKTGKEWADNLPKLDEKKPLDAIEKEISEAAETNKKAVKYEAYLEKVKVLGAKKKDLSNNKDKQAAKQAERLEYIKSYDLPFYDLSIGENGELLLYNKPLKDAYFSTGELLKVVPMLFSSQNPELKYVFLQDFNLLDEDKQKEIEEYLTSKGFQLVVEMVGKEKLTNKNCILLRDNVVVESYSETNQPTLL